MGASGGVGNAMAVLSVLDVMLRLFTYIAVISLSIKGIQGLNVYINKHKM